MYGLTETQFRNTFERVTHEAGVTGTNLLVALEMRLDNVVHRMGFASSRKAGRQLITHGHIEVNGGRVNVPSYRLKQGDEIKVRSKRNIVQSREFSEMLKKTLNAYHNRAIATQEVIEELIKLAKQMSAANQRGVELGLNDDEVAFYDALSANNSALEVMGKDNLKVIATELVTRVRKSVTIDWTLRESARAKIKVLVKRILRKHGYPPDLQDEATKLVLQQAELLCAEWAA